MCVSKGKKKNYIVSRLCSLAVFLQCLVTGFENKLLWDLVPQPGAHFQFPLQHQPSSILQQQIAVTPGFLIYCPIQLKCCLLM